MRLAAFGCTLFLASGFAGFAQRPTFDAASVRVISPDVVLDGAITGGPGTSDPGRFRAPRIDMWNLLTKAFGANLDQFVGPAWLRDFPPQNFYTVLATMPPDTTKEQFQLMLQNLMAERFRLVSHHETRNFPGYELVVDKGGPKFKEATPTQGENPDGGLNPRARHGADGFPDSPGSWVMGGSDGDQMRVKYHERTMAQFVSNLGFGIGNSQGKGARDGFPQPRVVDKTGLTGTYTFILEYSDQGAANLRSTLPDGGLPNIFTAIQKQLGLRLNKTADVPMDVIVVESVDKVPTEN